MTEGFVDFLKNHEPDLLSEGGCGEGVRLEEDWVRGCVVGGEGDCGDGVSSWGRTREEE